MQSSVETLSPTRVRLSVEVPFDELKPELDKAYRSIGKQVKVQGFRPGKVPPRILDQRVGRGVVLEEAVNEAIPRLYGEAVEAEKVFAVGRPEVAVTNLDDGVALAFTAEVDIRPEMTLPAYDALAVTVDDVVVSDEEIGDQLEGLRERFGSLSTVERAAADGDYVSLDLVASIDGEEVPGGTATGLSYRVGAGDMLDGLDEAVTGASGGDVRQFQTLLVAGDFEGKTADVAVTVRSVNERQLPELDDAWAKESTGFDTVVALTDDIRTRIDRAKRLQQGVDARDKVLDALLATIDAPLPESVVASELAWRRQSLQEQLTRSGQTLEAWLESEGKSAEEWEAELTQGAEQSVKAQLVLDTVADADDLHVSEAELSDQVVRRAARAGVTPQQYAEQIVQSGQLPGFVSEVRRGKALAAVMAGAVIHDASGNLVDLENLRDDMGGPEAEVELDEDGRPYHVHDDGGVHYLDEAE